MKRQNVRKREHKLQGRPLMILHEHPAAKYQELYVFGYTARNGNDPISKEIVSLRKAFKKKFAIRNSNANQSEWATETVEMPGHASKRAFVCPEQTGKVDSCGNCGACWSTKKNVAFLRH